MDGKTFGSVFAGTLGMVFSSSITIEALNITLTILSALSIILSMVLSLIKWYNDSKKDGKFTPDEVAKGVEIVKGATDEIKEVLEDDKQSKD